MLGPGRPAQRPRPLTAASPGLHQVPASPSGSCLPTFLLTPCTPRLPRLPAPHRQADRVSHREIPLQTATADRLPTRHTGPRAREQPARETVLPEAGLQPGLCSSLFPQPTWIASWCSAAARVASLVRVRDRSQPVSRQGSFSPLRPHALAFRAVPSLVLLPCRGTQICSCLFPEMR